jgi:DNA-directed RNA polymerase subunit F
MKILQQNGGLLTNSEVLQVLVDRGCATGSMALNARSLASEKMVYAYLQQHSAGLRTQEELVVVQEALQQFDLTRIEVLQIINLVPKSVVEVHLIVESCEARLTEDQVEEVLRLVRETLPQPSEPMEQ